jgi:hypothetical protein
MVYGDAPALSRRIDDGIDDSATCLVVIAIKRQHVSCPAIPSSTAMRRRCREGSTTGSTTAPASDPADSTATPWRCHRSLARTPPPHLVPYKASETGRYESSTQKKGVGSLRARTRPCRPLRCMCAWTRHCTNVPGHTDRYKPRV